MRLIEDWKVRLKHWSFQLNALGLLILGFIKFEPVGALAVWNMMPGPVARAIPPGVITAIGMTLFALSMTAKFVVQPKLEK